MTTLTRLLFLLAGILLAMASCKRDDDAGSNPGITRRIRSFETSACSGGTVVRYDFQGRQVFVFSTACGSDESYPVYDIDGTQICFIGGFSGSDDCAGSSFSRNATNPVTIYIKQ